MMSLHQTGDRIGILVDNFLENVSSYVIFGALVEKLIF